MAKKNAAHSHRRKRTKNSKAMRKLKNFKTITMNEGYEIKDLCFDQSGNYLAVAGTDVRCVHLSA